MKCSEIVPVVSSTKSVFPLRFLYLIGIALFLALETSEAVTNASSFKKGEILQNAEANLGKSTNQDGSNNSWTIRILYHCHRHPRILTFVQYNMKYKVLYLQRQFSNKSHKFDIFSPLSR